MTLTRALLPATLIALSLPYASIAQPAAKLKIKELKIGKGPKAKVGDDVEIDYTGMFTNGKTFDTSIGKQPLPFKIGQHQMIKGMEQGVVGMKVGGSRKLTIPPLLAYGPNGRDGIPPNATLIFTVKLLKLNGK